MKEYELVGLVALGLCLPGGSLDLEREKNGAEGLACLRSRSP